MLRILFTLAVALAATGLLNSEAHARRDRGSWKKTLHNKAVYFEKNTSERHSILGTFPSTVRLIPPKHYAGPQDGAWKQLVETGELPPGWIIDHGTTGTSNVPHSSSWTGCYLTGEAFRVAYLRDTVGTDDEQFKEAYERANEVIRGLRMLTLVSGQPGYLARGVAYGHGLAYEERGGTGARDLWAQGVGEYKHLRYRGGPSHHNYDHVFRGLGIYYFVAADDYQKRMIREIVNDMSDWAHLKNDMVVMHADGKRTSTVLIGGWRGRGGNDRPSGGSLMALTGLKISHKITGNERVGQLYDEWVERLGFRDPEQTQRSIMGEPRTNYDDTDHLLGDLYLLNMIEDDPELLAYYRKCVKDSWDVHGQDRMAWFNFVYRAVLGDEYGDAQGSLWNLQSFPTCRLFQPHLNSIRTDLEFVEGRRGGLQSRDPLPLYARPSDNEYEWKGSPYELDGRLSRTVTILEVSPHDEYVQFAADEDGAAYSSITRGEIWHRMGGLGGVRDFLFSPDYPWLAFAATTSGVYRTLDGGDSWSRPLAEPAERLKFDPENRNVLYAVGPQGVYKSADLGERDMGSSWRRVSGDPLPGGDNAFAVDPRGEKATLYLLARSGFYTKPEDAAEWTPAPRPTREYGFSDVDAVDGRPLWLRVDESRPGRLFQALHREGRRRSGTSISFSDDGGQTWTPVVQSFRALGQFSSSSDNQPQLSREELRRMYQRSRDLQFRDLRVDSKEPDTWYGLLETGVAVTRDAGQTWSIHSDGLDIPRVGAIWTPRHADLVAVGTPAGMYLSRDHGATFEDTSLVLQGGDAIRAEIGGIAYLIAYWMGRYHNFITEDEAHAEFWQP